MENDRFRENLIRALARDIDLHEKSAYLDVGADFDDLDSDRWSNPDTDLILAWNFWEAWIDEANHNFVGLYPGIGKNDWPRLASIVIASLADHRALDVPVILRQMDYRR